MSLFSFFLLFISPIPILFFTILLNTFWDQIFIGRHLIAPVLGMIIFLGGSTKLTFNQREPRDRNDCVKFNEIISGPWNFILLSSYCTDYNWLLDQFNGIAPGIAVNLIEHYDRNSDSAGIKKISLTSLKRELYLIHPKFPKFPNYGVMHCKLMILAADDFLRIVVSSANLMDYDYNEVQNVKIIFKII